MKNLKPIQWRQPYRPYGWWWGDTPLGRYCIWEDEASYMCQFKDQKLKDECSLDDAKAFCSAHHAAAAVVAALFGDADTTLKGT